MTDDLLALQRRISSLDAEIKRLRAALSEIAEWLRGPLRPDTLNEAIRRLNNELPTAERVLEVAWGCVSLEALQRHIRELAIAVGNDEYALFLNRALNRGASRAPFANGAKRQPLGGIR